MYLIKSPDSCISKIPSRDEALTILKKHNKDEFHLNHRIITEDVIKYYANELGCKAYEDLWEIVVLLHNLDFEKYPYKNAPIA